MNAAYLALQRPDANVLLVQFLLLEPDALHQIINTSVLRVQHELRKEAALIRPRWMVLVSNGALVMQLPFAASWF